MLRSVKELWNYVLGAEDGEIGRCRDFLFDDARYTIRYMVANTGKWLPKRKVLISPIFLGEVDWYSKIFNVKMTQSEVENAPALEQDAPVSRQYESALNRYLKIPDYWAGRDVWGLHPYPTLLYGAQFQNTRSFEEDNEGDPNLRSIREVIGYYILARDGEIGHVEDFIMEDQTWSLRYMVVDTRNWLPGKKVLISPTWTEAFHWPDGTAVVGLKQEQIEKSPEYDPNRPITRNYEKALYDYYKRSYEW